MADLQLKEEAVPLPEASSFFIFGPQNKYEEKHHPENHHGRGTTVSSTEADFYLPLSIQVP